MVDDFDSDKILFRFNNFKKYSIHSSQGDLIRSYNQVAKKLNEIYPPPDNYQLPILSEGGVCNGLSAYWIFANSMGGERLKGFSEILNTILYLNNTDQIINILENNEWEKFDEFANFFEMINQLQDPKGELEHLGQHSSEIVLRNMSENLPKFYNVNKTNVLCSEDQLHYIIENIINNGEYFKIIFPGHAAAIKVEDECYRIYDPNEGEIIVRTEDELIEKYMELYKFYFEEVYREKFIEGGLIEFSCSAISQNRNDIKYFPPKEEALDKIYQNANVHVLSKALKTSVNNSDFKTAKWLIDRIERLDLKDFNLGVIFTTPTIIKHPKLLSAIFKKINKKDSTYESVRNYINSTNFKDPELDNNLLQLCLIYNQPKSAEILIRNGFVPHDKNKERNRDGKNSYDLAIENGHENLAKKYRKNISHLKLKKPFNKVIHSVILEIEIET